MLIRKLKDIPEIIAGDKTKLKELLHPNRDYQFSCKYSIAHAIVSIGESSIKHKLSSSEVYYILKGNGEMHIDNNSVIIEAGDCFEILPNSVQWVKNIGQTDLEFLCIVDPAWLESDETILD
ncbi:MAG: cupin domain-containing protein [Candidatus Zixiibacteriota bacterium]|nr:MAG: cupin domain-containing protein [candidate division Zixibacteria bacterium]